MLNKNKIFKILNGLPFPRDQFWISSAASLVVHGVKQETRDIDLGCTEELFEYLIDQGYERLFAKNGDHRIIYNDNVEIYKNWGNGNSPFDIIQGFQFTSLNGVINVKKELNREKDIADIKLIRDYMRRQMFS